MAKKTPKKKEQTPMEQLTANYETFIKGKETTANGKKVFNSVLKRSGGVLSKGKSKKK